MLIKKLRLRNFGQHEDLELEFNGPVIGILGQNGKGKSTIAQAIVYAFLGDLPSSAADCIRHGEKQLRVDCEFTKGGKVGHITRIASRDGRASRSLVWGDEAPITKAKDVDLAMEEILGADKQTVLNSVFIAQGDISNIVKASSSKRIELLVKLLNLNYLNKRSTALDDTIKSIEKEVVPLEPLKVLLDKVSVELSKLDTGLKNKITDVDNRYGSVDFVKWILNTVNEYETHLAKLNSLLELQKLSISELNDSEERFKTEFSLLIKQLEINDIGFKELSEKIIEALREDINKAKEEYNKAYNERQKYLEYKALLEQYLNIVNNLKEYNDLRDTIFNGIEFDNIKVVRDLLHRRAEILIQIRSYELELKTDEDAYNDIINNKLPNLQKQSVDLEMKVKQLEESQISQRNVLSNLKNLLETKVKIKESFDKRHDDNGSTCPLCGLKLQLGQTISGDELDEIRGNIAFLESQLNTVDATLSNLRDRYLNVATEIVGLQGQTKDFEIRKKRSISLIENYKSDPVFEEIEKNEILSNVSNSDYDNFFKNIESHIEKYEVLNRLKLQQDSLLTFIKDQFSLKFNKDISTQVNNDSDLLYPKSKQDYYEQEPSKQQIVFCENRLEHAIRMQNDFVIKSDIIDKRNIAIQTIQDDIKNSNEDFTSIEKQMDVYKTELKATKLFSSIQNLSEIKKICNDEAIVEYQEVDRLKVEINLKKKEKESIEAQINDLETKNANIYQRLIELNTIKSLINPKEGITKQYLQYLFKVLSKYVSEYLLLMDANFIIKIDFEDEVSDPKTGTRENGLSYQFKRIDKADDYWLGMNRLSSGQKVKLSIAILIAIQKLICPDLNFLVLDEPSNSLDEPSVEALGTLLGNLGRTLSTNEGQIFIVDHNQILNRSFTTTVNL